VNVQNIDLFSEILSLTHSAINFYWQDRIYITHT